jgi:UDP-GlcNAc:undecaprenyl-phosphate GlcNAc-1-phosphate transferase
VYWLGLYSYLLTYLILPAFLDLLLKGGFTAKTFCGKVVPRGAGIIITATTVLVLITTLPFYFRERERETLILMFLLLAIGLLGFLDDAAGTKNPKGLIGHFRYFLLEGRLSTGFLKALSTVIISFFTSWLVNENIYQFLMNGILLSLSINALNLFDLRPGRAIKVFIFVMFLVFILSESLSGSFIFFFPTVGAVLAFMPLDLKGRAMLGDAGANVLGAIVGLELILVLPDSFKVMIIFLFIALHLLCERYSLTKIIEKIPLLAYFDRIGRLEP